MKLDYMYTVHVLDNQQLNNGKIDNQKIDNLRSKVVATICTLQIMIRILKFSNNHSINQSINQCKSIRISTVHVLY